MVVSRMTKYSSGFDIGVIRGLYTTLTSNHKDLWQSIQHCLYDPGSIWPMHGWPARRETFVGHGKMWCSLQVDQDLIIGSVLVGKNTLETCWNKLCLFGFTRRGGSCWFFLVTKSAAQGIFGMSLAVKTSVGPGQGYLIRRQWFINKKDLQ